MDSEFRSKQLTIFTLLFFGYANYACNRKSVSLAVPKLIEEGLSKNDAGLIASSQNLAFAISKFFSGVVSDRVSARLLFVAGLLLSGASTLIFSFTDSLNVFVLLWFINGLGQGAGWPACAKIIRTWSPASQFGTWWSVLSASTNVSGAVMPFVTAFIIVNFGWRSSLVVAGTLSIGIAILCLMMVLNTPEDIGMKSFAPSEPQDKSKTKSKGSQSDDDSNTWSALIRSPYLWLLAYCYMIVFAGKTSAVDWGQMYLMEDLGHSPYTGSAFTSSLETGGFIGGVASGYMTDWLVTRWKNAKSPRMPVAFLFTVGVAVGLHWFSFWLTEETTQFTISMVGLLLGSSFYGSISIFGVVAAEAAPSNMSGSAHAIVALAANLGAVVSGLPFSYIAKIYNWGTIFILLEVVTVATIVVMIVCWNMEPIICKRKKD